ncbi:hypothetical protein HDU76_005722 [Blyttiomyces sp. JEL0837]|nr:hypothetical protein HDU76_005722 [Blyttiomyces sp. JEL0837]
MSIAGFDQNAHMGDPSVSVNDPVFWLHHANVDRYWKYWQHANPTLALTYNGQRNFPPSNQNRIVNVSDSDILVGFQVSVLEGMGYNSGAFCHTYTPYAKSIASQRTSESALVRRRVNAVQRRAISKVDLSQVPVPKRVIPSPFPDSFFAMKWMRNMNVSLVREMERNSAALMMKIWDETDKIMDALYGANISTVSFENYAASVNHAINKIVRV